MQLDFRVMDLLASKICHDIISPVSAINNGVELIDDIGPSVMDDALKLIADSAGQASRRLKLFRIAYGRAGGEENLPFKDVRQTVDPYMASGKVSLTWDDAAMSQDFLDVRGALKVLVNALILAEEILPYGGSVRVARIVEGALGASECLGACHCLLQIKGRGVKISESYQMALEATVALDDLTPRTIQPYMTGRLAAYYGLEISWRQVADDHLDVKIFRENETSDDECVI